MGLFAQLTANGLIAGSIYALVAAGFALIYGTNRFMHFAHGASVVVGAYVLFALFSYYQVSFWVAVFLTVLISGFFGLIMNRLVYAPLKKRNASKVVMLIASLALLMLVQNLLQAYFGAQVLSIGYIPVEEGTSYFGAVITQLQLIIITSSALLFLGLWVFMHKTVLGRNMRAVADNPELAGIVGINANKVVSYSFFIGSALAGVAGILIGLEQSLNPAMGTMLIVKGFTGAVIGGITSVPAAVIGSLVLGLAENWGIAFVDSGFKDAIAFGLLFLFLLLKPAGLFGTDKGVKDR